MVPSKRVIEMYHASIDANYGDDTAMDVVKKGILKAASGWHNGFTTTAILEHHGLIKKSKKNRVKLTNRGKMFLWDVFKHHLKEPN